jgi:Flp pilus assembly protein TadD
MDGFVLCLAALFEIHGRVVPAAPAEVHLYGAITPFNARTSAGFDGKFKFKKLEPASYTVSVVVPGRAEVRKTVVVGPGTADKKRRVNVLIETEPAHVIEASRHSVSAKQLRVPPPAISEFDKARKRLERRDSAGAAAHLERALELAPHFAAAWNTLGTIAYQTGDYQKAERCFRNAIEQEPTMYEPRVNLGGVLLNLNRAAEALPLNSDAAKERPNDALAHSQLGLTYFYLEKFEQAKDALETAKRLDPAHFSRPQWTLAQIHARQGNYEAAASELEQLASFHPDLPEAKNFRKEAARLRATIR